MFIQGASGSGKSTLLGLLGGVLVPQAGTVRVLGTDLAALSGRARDRFRVDHIGFIFQQFNLIPYLSVLDNVLLPCRLSARRASALRRPLVAEAEHLLAELDLDRALWSRRAAALSVGQQQRAAAARALIGTPELVIADEPASALDAARQAGFLKLLRAQCAASRATLIFVSHDERLARHFTRSIALESLNHALDRVAVDPP